jgi:hypothetical protein
MEVYGILNLLENIFKLSKSEDDKRLALQQKFAYILHKKQDITVNTVRAKLYSQALQYLNDINYHSIKQLLEDYINYYENNTQDNNQSDDTINITLF